MVIHFCFKIYFLLATIVKVSPIQISELYNTPLINPLFRDPISCSIQYKIAFQQDAYRPLVDRISHHALRRWVVCSLGGGAVSAPGGPAPMGLSAVGVSALGVVSAPGGCIPACTEADNSPPHHEQNS